MHEGKPHHVVVAPDHDMKVVNKGGDHSIRGGCLAKKCYTEEGPTSDRLKTPLVRVNGKLMPISWDDATSIFAELTRYTLKKNGIHSWGLKQFSYGYYENTYALTRLALDGIGSPVWSEHDQPGAAPSTPGWQDIGFDNFAPAYEDWYLADTLLLAGTDPFETKTIIWNEYIMKAIVERGQKVIMMNPRRTSGGAFVEKNGGLLLQVNPGSDAAVLLAMQRIILENGWEDSEWIKKYTANKWETEAGFGQGTRNTPWQWRTTWGKLGTKGFEDYKAWVLSQKESQLEVAAKIAGLDPDEILEAAELLAKPVNGKRVKTSIGIEKGLYWSNNYGNTAAVGTLALLCGTGNRPGQMIGRLGGHQRGMIKGGGVNLGLVPEKFMGRRRKTFNVDRWVANGNVRFMWVVGTTWTSAQGAASDLADSVRKMTVDHPVQLSSSQRNQVVATIKKRMDQGGMFLVHQDIYLRPIIGEELADMILPASGWGENDFTRCNGERRLRLYSKFYDAPGEAKPDWWIAARIAKKLGLKGYDWQESNDVFEEAARFRRGKRTDLYPLVWLAKKKKVKAHELLRKYGTEGIQCPIRYEDGKLIGTKRLHDSTLKLPETGPEGPTVWHKKLKAFGTQSGKANFIKAPWSLWEDFYDAVRPKDDELWVTSGRVNEVWQSSYDDNRRPYIAQRWPENFCEIHPEDATSRGIESGDYILAYSDRVPVQKGGYMARDYEDLSYAGLLKQGQIKFVRGEVKAVAMVTEITKKGVAFMNFLDPRNPANNLAPAVADPVSNNARFKMGVGRIKKIGESPYKEDLRRMTFAQRSWEV